MVAASNGERSLHPPIDSPNWRAVEVFATAVERAWKERQTLELVLPFSGGEALEELSLERRSVNSSRSISWIGQLEGKPGSRVVLIEREGVIVGSIRTGEKLFMLSYAGSGRAHLLYEVDEDLARFEEEPPTGAPLSRKAVEEAGHRERLMRRGLASQDDGLIQDLLVVYSAQAVEEVGGLVAMENLIDLGVTETNLSYEGSGVTHRIRLVGTALTDYDVEIHSGDPRDLLQNPSDGVMDDVHPLRDRLAADLVKLIIHNGGGCGRAFRMDEVSLAHAEFAFCYTNHVCVSPGYTFQHELGHIQAARHQRSGGTEGSPFSFNYGYIDTVNRFRTIMAAGSMECPDGCPRRLAWSNPLVLDPQTGEPTGIAEGEPEAADNHKTLNDTAWTVANFRVSQGFIFFDGFETGDTTGWSEQR